MDQQTAIQLNELNQKFYWDNCQSFSMSRSLPWQGWQLIANHLECENIWQDAGSVNVLDVACGNMRFEEFMVQRFADVKLRFDCIDSCIALLPERMPGHVNFESVDIIENLFECRALPIVGSHDLTVCFGFMHHVPGEHNRKRLLYQLLDSTAINGYCVVSLWSFAEGLGLKKAQRQMRQTLLTADKSTQGLASRLDDGDYLLGWQNIPGAVRYCHSFSMSEADILASSLGNRGILVDSFKSDGKTGDQNLYLVFRRR